MIEVGVEIFAFGYLQTIWRFEVVSSHDVIDIVDSSCSKPDFGEISRPHTTISIFGLILREIGCVDVIVNITISLVPFLIVKLFIVMVSRMDCEVFCNPG